MWQGRAVSMMAVAWLATSVLTLPAFAQSSKEQARYAEAQGWLDDYAGDTSLLNRAQQVFDDLLNANPNNALAYVGMGRVTYKRGYISGDDYEPVALEHSHAHFKKAMTLNSRLFDAYYYGAYPYLYQKNYAKVREYAEIAARLKYDAIEVDVLNAKLAAGQQNYAEAERLARKILAKSNDSRWQTNGHQTLLMVYRAQKRDDMVEQSYLAMLGIEPDSAWNNVNYANFLVGRGQPDKAIAYAKKALAVMDFGMGHNVLSRALYEKGAVLMWKQNNPAEALPLFAQSVQHNPRLANAWYGLGLTQYTLGHAARNEAQLRDAEMAFTAALRIDPNHKQAQEQLDQLRKLLAWIAQQKK